MIFTIATVGFVFIQGRIPHSGHFHQENKKTAAATNNTHSTTFSQHWWSLYSVMHRQHSLGFHWTFNMNMHTPAAHRTSLLCLIHRTRHCTQHTDSIYGEQCYCLHSAWPQLSNSEDGPIAQRLQRGDTVLLLVQHRFSVFCLIWWTRCWIHHMKTPEMGQTLVVNHRTCLVHLTWRTSCWIHHTETPRDEEQCNCLYTTGPWLPISLEGIDAGSITQRLQREGRKTMLLFVQHRTLAVLCKGLDAGSIT